MAKQSGPAHWHWKGGERSTKQGYVRVWIAPGKRDLEHRVVWMATYGPIPRGMHVHHLNGDKTDNRADNLVLVSNVDHQALHHADRVLGTRWSLKHNACIACGKTDYPHQARGLCKLCHGRKYYDATHSKRRRAKKSDHPDEWSYLHHACVGCGTTERPHRSRGMCGACYQKYLRSR